MSCYYKLLPRLIPEVILSSGKSSQIIIVSPWIHNVDLITPKFGMATSFYDKETIKFDSFIKRMMTDFKMKILVMTRPNDTRTEGVLRNLRISGRDNFAAKYFDHLHAKMIVTPDLAIEMSANIIPTSLFRNIESCTLLQNRFSKSREYVKNKLGDII